MYSSSNPSALQLSNIRRNPSPRQISDEKRPRFALGLEPVLSVIGLLDPVRRSGHQQFGRLQKRMACWMNSHTVHVWQHKNNFWIILVNSVTSIVLGFRDHDGALQIKAVLPALQF